VDERYPIDEGSADEAALFISRRGAAGDDPFRSLILLDLPAARSAFENILKETLDRTPEHSHASYLLYDILSRVERVVADHQGLPPRPVAERMTTVRKFASAKTREDLLWAFWSAYEAATSLLGVQAPACHPSVERVKAYVREHYTGKISLTEIAEAVGVSRNYLSHLFRKHCSLTVTEFIHRTRMREAERFLVTGDKTVSEIAYLVGYQNYRDFHRNFVKYQKTSPKRFRQIRAAARRPLAAIPT
jgi:YesN/AraC family two-component response regulator